MIPQINHTVNKTIYLCLGEQTVLNYYRKSIYIKLINVLIRNHSYPAHYILLIGKILGEVHPFNVGIELEVLKLLKYYGIETILPSLS